MGTCGLVFPRKNIWFQYHRPILHNKTHFFITFNTKCTKTTNKIQKNIRQLGWISAIRMTLNNKTADHFFRAATFLQTHKLFVIYFNSYRYISESCLWIFRIHEIVATDCANWLLYVFSLSFIFAQTDRKTLFVYEIYTII